MTLVLRDGVGFVPDRDTRLRTSDSLLIVATEAARDEAHAELLSTLGWPGSCEVPANLSHKRRLERTKGIAPGVPGERGNRGDLTIVVEGDNRLFVIPVEDVVAVFRADA